MNFWTGLILGIIIGWLIEWLIDWLFWRRDAAEAREAALALEQRAATAEANAAEWEERVANAEEEYQTRLRAVEDDWQARLNLNEQQWQNQFAALEQENDAMRGRSVDAPAGAALGVGLAAATLMDAATDAPTGDLSTQLDGLDDDMEERLRLAGIESAGSLAAADPAALAVALGVSREAAQTLIERAGGPAADVIPEPPQSAPQRDDLTRVHGIGPKYAGLLNEAGISSYDELAAADPDRLREIIHPGPMQQVNFDSWVAQATALAATRGARVDDDLTRIEGIGPKYAAMLRQHGITGFADLAAADESALAAIIAAPAWRRVNYADWITQARLLAGGDEAGLAELQARLFHREGDNLGLIRGVGARSATALQAAGITTFAALAQATPQDLDGIVREAGVRGSFDYEAWINEAGVRAAGKRVSSGRPRPTHVVPCPQDLSAVPGVGQVFEDRLYAAGIGSYWELAETPADELATILDVRAFQGVDLDAIKAAAMRQAVESNALGRGWDGTPPDDFVGLPGIGEVYERRLYEAGICTYAALAATTAERLAEVCQAPRSRTPDYAAWIALAAERVAAQEG
jgi:predicted flap endonuclease-1-like 5' DNA nuclease